MVMHLPLPPYDSVQLVRDVVAERAAGVNAAFFNGIEDQWVARVQAYVDNAGTPSDVPSWPQIQVRSNTFLNLYLSPADGSAQGDILVEMRDHELSICPSCGELGRPNTLDHYLPKAAYPHLCITPANLFPMCDACQRAKGSKVGDAVSPRFFLHPYYDVFVAAQVLRLEIAAPFDAPSFALQVADDLTKAQADLVRVHLRELEIPPRFAIFFRGHHRRLLRLVSKMRSSGQNVFATLSIFQHGVADASLNSWEHVFYSSVLGNPALLDYLANSNLPDYL